MGNIVLIEPYRILQQAIALSLAPDHKVQVRESMAGAELQTLEECDLVVVDAAALAEKKMLTAEFLSGLQGCAIPVLWLEDEQPLDPPKKEKLQIIKKPLVQKAFKEAVGNLLAPQNRSERETQDQRPNLPGKVSPKSLDKKEAAGGSDQPSLGFIDLIEVVGEPLSGGGKKAPKKSN